MTWIQTSTGKKFYTLDPRPHDVCAEDIAHALSMKCRFGGHCHSFYSVAQHSVLVSRNVPLRDALWGLLHDAAEAYLPDVCRPIKAGMPNFASIERTVMLAVQERFGLVGEMPESVKNADLVLLATERRDLMMQGPVWESLVGVEPLSIRIEAALQWEAKREFLARLEELTNV